MKKRDSKDMKKHLKYVNKYLQIMKYLELKLQPMHVINYLKMFMKE